MAGQTLQCRWLTTVPGRPGELVSTRKRRAKRRTGKAKLPNRQRMKIHKTCRMSHEKVIESGSDGSVMPSDVVSGLLASAMSPSGLLNEHLQSTHLVPPTKGHLDPLPSGLSFHLGHMRRCGQEPLLVDGSGRLTFNLSFHQRNETHN